MDTIRKCVLATCGCLLAGALASAEVVSGLEVGTPTVSIPVLDVTGAYAGKRICYVCEFQDDPNVLAFFRDTGENTAALIIQLNELYLEHKDKNFKVVAAIVAGEEASPWLEALNAREEIEIPLVVLRRGPKDVAVRLYELNPDVENTFLVTVNRFVAANVSAIGPDQFGEVIDATAEMLATLRAGR
jgi:hypothetical protein